MDREVNQETRRSRKVWVGVAAAAALVGGGVLMAERERLPLEERQAEVEQRRTVLSEVYSVDKIYRSMTGPWGTQRIQLGPADTEELVWITGYRAVMVGADGETEMPQQYMCHSNLDIDLARHREALGESPGFGPRLFTLSQGQLEIDFPPGFGIPVRSSEALNLTTQVLNLNHRGEAQQVRHKVSVDYVLDSEFGEQMTPLLPTAAYGLALLDGPDGFFGVKNPEEHHGPGCLVEDSASEHSYSDGLGRVFTGHWQVPPGRQENRTLVTHLMRVPYETTIHYIAVHLHPYAESLVLRDLTTGETLFESQARNFEDLIGLHHVDAFSSVEGVTVFPDHEYELVSVYQNDSEEMQDSMAVMYLYLHDHATEDKIASIRGR
ncbi:MAG: hypothetical protein AAGM22_01620 [Acidobacteriota bacterium]